MDFSVNLKYTLSKQKEPDRLKINMNFFLVMHDINI